MPGPDLLLLRLKALKEALLRVLHDRGVEATDDKYIDITTLEIDTDTQTIRIKYVFMSRPTSDEEDVEYQRGYVDGFVAGWHNHGS
jgi:hypothetical protein